MDDRRCRVRSCGRRRVGASPWCLNDPVSRLLLRRGYRRVRPMATRTQTSQTGSSKRGRFLGFLAVGATGLAINQLAFWMLTDVFGLYYLWGFLLATQFST